MTENDEADRNAGHGPGRLLAAGLGVLVFYVLSTGPFIWLGERGYLGSLANRTARIIYAPIIWSIENTPLRKPLEMYFRLWESRAAVRRK